mgnify:CR=1 FL=1
MTEIQTRSVFEGKVREHPEPQPMVTTGPASLTTITADTVVKQHLKNNPSAIKELLRTDPDVAVTMLNALCEAPLTTQALVADPVRSLFRHVNRSPGLVTIKFLKPFATGVWHDPGLYTGHTVQIVPRDGDNRDKLVRAFVSLYEMVVDWLTLTLPDAETQFQGTIETITPKVVDFIITARDHDTNWVVCLKELLDSLDNGRFNSSDVLTRGLKFLARSATQDKITTELTEWARSRPTHPTGLERLNPYVTLVVGPYSNTNSTHLG